MTTSPDMFCYIFETLGRRRQNGNTYQVKYLLDKKARAECDMPPRLFNKTAVG